MNVSRLLLSTTAAVAIAGSFGYAYAQSSDQPSRHSPSGNSTREDTRMFDPGNPMDIVPLNVPLAAAPQPVIVERVVERIVEVEKIVYRNEPTGAVAYQPRPARSDRN